MEEISETAKAYYANSSNRQKQIAIESFKSMDKDGDGKISFEEYEEHMKQQKDFKTIATFEFFKKLDKDGNGTLDFYEFIIVYYLHASGRVYYCDECRAFLDGVYFTCVQCFNGSGNSYDLCCSCYKDKNINHHKDALFLDNYTLLHAKRLHKGSQDQSIKGALEALRLANAGTETISNIISLCSQM